LIELDSAERKDCPGRTQADVGLTWKRKPVVPRQLRLGDEQDKSRQRKL